MEDKFTLEDYIYVPIEPELARKLLKNYGKDWCVMYNFNDFCHCLKDTLKAFDDKFNPKEIKNYIYVPIKPEVARNLLKEHGKDWEPFDEFNGFYHCLKDTLEDFGNRYEPKKEESEF